MANEEQSSSNAVNNAWAPQGQPPRTLVLCFDGTTNAFDTTNTNVAKFFQLLDKTDITRQLCYYQPGVGTYTLPSIITPITSFVTKIVDMGVAWFFGAHVTSGYQFMCDNYRPGDKICLLGFSRGAYTARALAGMVEKVGLVPAGNAEQHRFAWDLYKQTSPASQELAAKFKASFSRHVEIDFVGVWDTVASVGGAIENHYPYTSNNRSIKIFRHAISLDERRVKFAQNRYHATVDEAADGAHDPESSSSPSQTTRSFTPWRTAPPTDDFQADVDEVYFAGCHTDVGGGNQLDSTDLQLSNITLDWMVSQVLKADLGVRFDEAALAHSIATFAAAGSMPLNGNGHHDASGAKGSRSNGGDVEHDGGAIPDTAGVNANIRPPIQDALRTYLFTKRFKFSNLIRVPLWWILEFLPFRRKYQDYTDPKKKWKVTYVPHVGMPRQVAPGSKIHESVRDKMRHTDYRPAPKLPDDVKWVPT